MLHVVSTMVLVLIGLGLYYRRQTSIHWKLMTGAFVTDFALVLYIELTRHAVEATVTQVRPFVWFHAAISTTVLVLYVVLITLGRRLATVPATAARLSLDHKHHQTRSLHRNLGMTFCVFRMMNYATALML
ncbi:MAG: hypothetical protein HY040_19015 [Planctomycetes bacterium]|nr:hypothetical protein [Planctomycetota bacterium]